MHEALEGGEGGGERRHLGRGRRPAHAAAARRGGARRVGEEDEPLRRRARGRDADGLRRRGRGGVQYGAFDWLDAPIERVGREVHAAAVRAGDGGVRRPARGRRARGDQAHGGRAMATEIKLPRLGQGMESGTIVKWLKSEGEPVEKGEPLYELDTDKVTQEVEADASGVLLKIAVAEGEVDGRHDDRRDRRAGRGRRPTDGGRRRAAREARVNEKPEKRRPKRRRGPR